MQTLGDPYRPNSEAKLTVVCVSSSSSGRSIGSYRCVPRHCPSSRQACRSNIPYCSRARPTAQRRRSGLRSFPPPRPSKLASPATARLPVASAAGFPSATASVAGPGQYPASRTASSTARMSARKSPPAAATPRWVPLPRPASKLRPLALPKIASSSRQTSLLLEALILPQNSHPHWFSFLGTHHVAAGWSRSGTRQ